MLSLLLSLLLLLLRTFFITLIIIVIIYVVVFIIQIIALASNSSLYYITSLSLNLFIIVIITNFQITLSSHNYKRDIRIIWNIILISFIIISNETFNIRFVTYISSYKTLCLLISAVALNKNLFWSVFLSNTVRISIKSSYISVCE